MDLEKYEKKYLEQFTFKEKVFTFFFVNLFIWGFLIGLGFVIYQLIKHNLIGILK